MTTHRFYVPDLDPDSSFCQLSQDQSRQVSRVLRLRRGDVIVVFGGDGMERAATLDNVEDGRWRLCLGSALRPAREPTLNLTVGLAILRNERFDLAIQKLTEIGVARIVPIAAERSVISYADSEVWEKRRRRILRLIVEAAEQSERTTLPVIGDPLSLAGFLCEAEGAEICALVERSTANHISRFHPSGGNLALLIGPEGGWSRSEIEAMEDRTTPLTTGPLILRSETAAITVSSFLIFSSTPSGTN